MNSFTLFFLFYFFIAFSLFSQSKGFFGKKNIVEFGVTFQNPLLYNYRISNLGQIETGAFLNENGTLVSGKPKINLGYRFSLGRIIEKNFGFYIESGLSYFSVVPNLNSTSIFSQNSITKYSNLYSEMLDIRSFTIMPKIEFANNDALLPLGISNQFGVGFNYYKTLSKEYIGTFDQTDDLGNITSNNKVSKYNYYNFSDKSIKGYSLMYKLTMRIPISESLLFHFGFRYTFNFVPSYFIYSNSSNSILSQENMRNMIKLKENRNLINFETGLSFCF